MKIVRPSCSMVVDLPCTGGCRVDAPAEGLREGLVAEADAERGHAGLGHAPHGLQGDAGLIGRAGTGRDDAAVIGAVQ